VSRGPLLKSKQQLLDDMIARAAFVCWPIVD
jgi:hypothetical protein